MALWLGSLSLNVHRVKWDWWWMRSVLCCITWCSAADTVCCSCFESYSESDAECPVCMPENRYSLHHVLFVFICTCVHQWRGVACPVCMPENRYSHHRVLFVFISTCVHQWRGVVCWSITSSLLTSWIVTMCCKVYHVFAVWLLCSDLIKPKHLTGTSASWDENDQVWHYSNITCSQLRERLGIDDIIIVVQQHRLRWHGRVLRQDEHDSVKNA